MTAPDHMLRAVKTDLHYRGHPHMKSSHHWNDTSYRIILNSADTNGAMSVIHGVAGPMNGPAEHVHEFEDEIFIVLEGEIEFEVSGMRFLRGPLGTAFIPRGQPHSFRTGPEGARAITVLTPGGFEGFFADMATRQLRLPQDIAEIAATAASFGSRFVGPGLAHREMSDA